MGIIKWSFAFVTIRKKITRKDHRWHILRILIELGTAQVFIHRMCPGPRVLVPITCKIRDQ